MTLLMALSSCALESCARRPRSMSAGKDWAADERPSRAEPFIGPPANGRGSRALPESGVAIMGQSWLFSGLLSVPLLLATGGTATAQGHAHVDPAANTAEQGRPAVLKTVRWSDPSAWPDGKVPGAGDAVTIARSTEVVLDVDPPALRSLTVDGKLRFAND